MAQNILSIKILNEALKAGSRCSRRSMHDGATSKKNLHNTESVLGLVADSMGRTRGKLSGTEDRNGMTRVGPNPDILQVSRAASEAVTGKEQVTEDKNNFVSADPNSSMWNMYKDKESEGVAKKLTVKFRKMKDNIKQYYLDRLEENQVMFTEIDEPLTIPKFDKKERVPKYRVVEVREEEPEEEMVVVKRPRKHQKLSLFNQLQNRDGEPKEEELDSYSEVRAAEPQAKGYKKFNKMDYRSTNKSDDGHGRDIELRGGGRVAMAKPSGKSMMAEDDQEPRSIWKKSLSSKGEKDSLKERSDAGFSDVGGMASAVHFKTTLNSRPLGRGGILDTIRSDELVHNAIRKRLSEPRYFSTMNSNINPKSWRPTMTEAFDKYKPVNIALQRQIAIQNESMHNVASNNLLMAHSLSTCCRLHTEDDGCRPSTMPPKDCNYPNKLEKCPKLVEKEWPCCDRICVCGCDAPNPKSFKVQAGATLVALLAVAKRPEYRCPAFSECARISTLVKKKPSECCISGKTCDRFVGASDGSTTALQRQEKNLGQKYWTGQQQPQQQQQQQYHTSCFQQRRGLHISRPMFAEGGEAEETCEKKSGGLPCLKPSQIPGGRKKVVVSKGSCDKLCMPCCEPARDPPECFSVYTKGPCEKFRNPRPSFSECRKRFPFKHTMCECEVPKKPLCKDKKKSEPTC